MLLFIALVSASSYLPLALALLSKSALHPNLDYLEAGNEKHLPSTKNTVTQWPAGWIPKDCYDIAKTEKFKPNDVQAYNVKYADCSDAWVLCRHKASPNSLAHMVELFGKLPVGMRSFVKHLITLPAPSTWAYEQSQNIAVFGLHNTGGMDVLIHETGHAMDFGGAFPGTDTSHAFHDTSVWKNNYKQDPDVPDNYARTNIIEDVAQVTVVSVFDKVVPGGFGTAEPNWRKIYHQYATLQWQAGARIVPGGICKHRFANSVPVLQSGARSRVKAREAQFADKPPDVSLSSAVTVMKAGEHSTKEACKDASV